MALARPTSYEGTQIQEEKSLKSAVKNNIRNLLLLSPDLLGRLWKDEGVLLDRRRDHTAEIGDMKNIIDVVMVTISTD